MWVIAFKLTSSSQSCMSDAFLWHFNCVHFFATLQVPWKLEQMGYVSNSNIQRTMWELFKIMTLNLIQKIFSFDLNKMRNFLRKISEICQRKKLTSHQRTELFSRNCMFSVGCSVISNTPFHFILARYTWYNNNWTMLQ